MARRKMKNWVAASILFFSLVAIVITGFGTGGTGGLGSLSSGGAPTGTEVAKVGQVAITTNVKRVAPLETSTVISVSLLRVNSMVSIFPAGLVSVYLPS